MSQVDQPDPGALLRTAVDAVSAQVDQMGEADWSAPSPCDEWNGQQVLNHVSDTLTGILGMLDDESYRDVKQGDGPAPATPTASAARWHELAERARTAAAGLDPGRQLTGPMGLAPAAEALKIPTHDLTVHAWDLAATGGRELELDETLRADLDALVHQTPPEFLRQPGIFGPEVEPPADANATERLMAFLGRRRPA